MTSVGKAIYILKCLSEPPYEFGITQLAINLNMAKSGVHKIVSALVSERLVVQAPGTSKYHLGPAVLRMGAAYSNLRGIEEVSKSVMEAISKITKTSVLVGLRDSDEAFLAYKIDAPGYFSYDGYIGRNFPFHAGAIGKILGAYMDEDKIREILKNRDLEKKTPLTIVSLEELLQQYKDIREQGYAASYGENIGGAFGLAAPIFDRNEQVWACLCIAGPLEFYQASKEEAWIRLLKEGAKEISFKLGVRL